MKLLVSFVCDAVACASPLSLTAAPSGPYRALRGDATSASANGASSGSFSMYIAASELYTLSSMAASLISGRWIIAVKKCNNRAWRERSEKREARANE